MPQEYKNVKDWTPNDTNVYIILIVQTSAAITPYLNLEIADGKVKNEPYKRIKCHILHLLKFCM